MSTMTATPMEIREFFELARAEGDKEVTRVVRGPSAELLSAARRPGGMLLTDFLAKTPAETKKTTAYRHILGPAASSETIAARERELGVGRFPADLRTLLASVNGIHLWARSDTGRAHHGIAPLEEWELARVKMYGPTAPKDLLDDRYVALSYDEDGAAYVVLDALSGTYFLMDTAGPDASAPIGRSVGELLEWIWANRISPK